MRNSLLHPMMFIRRTMRMIQMNNALELNSIDRTGLVELFSQMMADNRERSLRFDELLYELRWRSRKLKHGSFIQSGSSLTDKHIQEDVIKIMRRFSMYLQDIGNKEFEGLNYEPKFIDSRKVHLSELVKTAAHLLAINNHDLWALARIKEGWQWGPTLQPETKLSPNLVPFDELPEEERNMDVNGVTETLKVICALGWTIVRQTQGKTASETDRDKLEKKKSTLKNLKFATTLTRWNHLRSSSSVFQVCSLPTPTLSDRPPPFPQWSTHLPCTWFQCISNWARRGLPGSAGHDRHTNERKRS